MEKRYPADIIPRIKVAINRINESTTLHVTLEIRRIQRGKAIFIFRKQPEAQQRESNPIEPSKPLSVWDIPVGEEESLLRLLALLPDAQKEKTTVVEMVSEALRKQGEEYTRRNIEYSNRNAKKNYRAFLSKALKEDWGEGEERVPTREEKAPPQEEGRRGEEEVAERTLEALLGFSVADEEWTFEKVIGYVRDDEREDEEVQILVAEALQERGVEFALWNILYANKCFRPARYAVFLRLCFVNNHGTQNGMLFS